MRIGIDIDGVLYPWTEAANEALVWRFGIVNPGPHRYWDWLKEQLTPGQWLWLWSKEGQEAVFDQPERTYPGAVEAIDAILGSGHECHFVTHRDPACTALHTVRFLTYHFGHRSWAGVHVLKDTPKHELARWDVFIDDKPDTVKDMLLWTRAHVFAPVRPWNSELAEYPVSRLTYYTDPREIVDWVIAQ